MTIIWQRSLCRERVEGLGCINVSNSLPTVHKISTSRKMVLYFFTLDQRLFFICHINWDSSWINISNTSASSRNSKMIRFKRCIFYRSRRYSIVEWYWFSLRGRIDIALFLMEIRIKWNDFEKIKLVSKTCSELCSIQIASSLECIQAFWQMNLDLN